jgi:hypothetical protein
MPDPSDKMSLTALEWGLRAPITPRFGGNLEALPRPQDTEPKQQQKTDLKHKESDRPQAGETSQIVLKLAPFMPDPSDYVTRHFFSPPPLLNSLKCQ